MKYFKFAAKHLNNLWLSLLKQFKQRRSKDSCQTQIIEGILRSATHTYTYKFSKENQNLVHSHILSFPQWRSHYSRKKSSPEHLSPDPNMNHLHTAFKIKHPNGKVTYTILYFCFWQTLYKIHV